MRARGLKRPVCGVMNNLDKSRPMRARGLKPFPEPDYSALMEVAPHAGAWIETLICLLGN